MRVVFALVMGSAAACSHAQSIHAYKSVHADGTVSYSQMRPATQTSAEELTIIQNSADIEQQGEGRQQQMEAIGKELEKQRLGNSEAMRGYQDRVSEARQEVTDAERNLVTAQQSKKNATPERIEDAQERVRLARRHLREVQSAEP